jgi:hypothetical protein
MTVCSRRLLMGNDGSPRLLNSFRQVFTFTFCIGSRDNGNMNSFTFCRCQDPRSLWRKNLRYACLWLSIGSTRGQSCFRSVRCGSAYRTLLTHTTRSLRSHHLGRKESHDDAVGVHVDHKVRSALDLLQSKSRGI